MNVVLGLVNRTILVIISNFSTTFKMTRAIGGRSGTVSEGVWVYYYKCRFLGRFLHVFF